MCNASPIDPPWKTHLLKFTTIGKKATFHFTSISPGGTGPINSCMYHVFIRVCFTKKSVPPFASTSSPSLYGIIS